MATNLDLKKTTADLRHRAEELRKALSDPTPLYAVAGIGDAAVEKLREMPTRVTKLRTEIVGQDKSVQERVSEAVLSIPAEALQLTAKISAFAEDGVKKAEAQYKDLAGRGEKIVKRISNQKATQDLITQAQTTVTKARVARGTASRGAEATKTAAKSTATAARKTAKTATKAAAAGAGKVGD